MSRLTQEHKQRLNVRETQLEIPTDPSTAISDDFEGKLVAAQQQLESLQQQQEALERQKRELEELNERRDEFLHGQVEINEKLKTALTTIDRELFEMRQEMEDFEQTRACFAEHLQNIEALNPESWTRDTLRTDLGKAISTLDLAEDEYEQAMEHFSSTNRVSLLGSTPKKTRVNSPMSSQFSANFKNGLAFNLPLILAGAIALILLMAK